MDLLGGEDIVMSTTSFFMLNILSGCEGIVGALNWLRESCDAPSVEDVEVKGITHTVVCIVEISSERGEIILWMRV